MDRPIRREILTITLWSVFAILVFAVGLWIWGAWHDEWSGYNANLSISDGVCNIAVASINGDITTMDDSATTEGTETPPTTNADDVIALLHTAEADPYVLGVIVNIDSLGGVPVASELIANALKNLSLPTVALIREFGTSGGYLAATGADTIIASPFSDVGSIGITLSYLENWEKNAKEGLRFISLSSGKFKDYGSPNKPLTADERALLERDLKIYHDRFVKEVAENRKLPVEDVARIADGSSMPGELAFQNKLIDALGDQETARAWFAGRLDKNNDEIIFCE